ncbi:DNA excision repair protein ERCC-1 [Harpia harpyja]|uniref:DNA excision repair protein ERCC-1 n=1 Tax=Harpia harpyja TaxID=202280 RepID=UPI0022B08AC4|nr:DNA excision repair protein ERCC-1 [Harpia harpyja]
MAPGSPPATSPTWDGDTRTRGVGTVTYIYTHTPAFRATGPTCAPRPGPWPQGRSPAHHRGGGRTKAAPGRANGQRGSTHVRLLTGKAEPCLLIDSVTHGWGSPPTPPAPRTWRWSPGGGCTGRGWGQPRGRAPLPLLKPGAKSSSIVISPRQQGNPVLKFICNVPWEFGDIVPDYVLGQSTCALFLSLRYHHLNPGYIHDRLQHLGRSYGLQLLLQVDVKDPHQALKELAKICILADCTLLVAWSPEEAGRYLETYKAYEQKPPDLLKEWVEQDFLSWMTDCLTSIKLVNKMDALSLLTTFGLLAAVVDASREDLSLCPSVGPQKAKRLFDVLHEPFLKVPK